MAIPKAPRRGVTDPKDARPPRTNATCKTCTSCRQKKIKCDGIRPTCRDCTMNGMTCSYPRDARRELRPTRARVQGLEHTVAAMLEHMKASGVVLPESSAMDEDHLDEMEQDAEQESQDQARVDIITAGPDPSEEALLPTPPVSTSKDFGHQNRPGSSALSYPVVSGGHEPSDGHGGMFGIGSVPQNSASGLAGILTPANSQTQSSSTRVETLGNEGGSGTNDGLSPCEARVAGVFHEHGCVSSVHGIAGIMNTTSRERHKENISQIARKGETAVAESKARLISNAVLQRQREVRMFRQPQNLMDLDGCPPELAKHLLDMHFNRQHYAYLLTYRPAIMDSLASGGGPWLNKLLLNAIFYSSALYSDRQCLRAEPGSEQSTGLHYYHRFKQLLVEEIDKPSIPSAVALLLTSASLISQGHSSAGWNLSGTAYRMILDLGCHLMLGPEYQSASDHSGRKLHRDLEQEMRKRLYWGAYVTDATQALYLGRPCMFASVEARVPLQLLDTFEELEDWQPYTDQSCSTSTQPPYSPHPAYAVSTFMALARLLQISTRITDLYGIQSIKLSTETLLERKRTIECELEDWRNSIPEHLQQDPDGSSTPPPHLLTPHTTYHALIILLQRAFLEEGHLRRHTDEAAKRRGQEIHVHSALMIQKYVRAYRDAFTLRRAPFLLSYAVYSAVTVIVRYARLDHGRFREPISFFWTCLNELRHGCNFGLLKPLAILQDMVHELQYSDSEGSFCDSQQQLEPSFDESLFSTLNKAQETGAPATHMPAQNSNGFALDQWSTAAFGPTSGLGNGMLDFLDDGEWNVSQDALYGLFAPSQNFP